MFVVSFLRSLVSLDSWHFHCVLPNLRSGFCCQPGHCLIGTICIQNLQEEKERWPIPRETRNAYDTFSLPTFPGFELQFYLLLLSFWKGIKKKKDFLMLAVVLSKKRYRFQFLVQNKQFLLWYNLKKKWVRYLVDSCVGVFQCVQQ